MPLPIINSSAICTIGVAILAEVGAGVVFAYVFADDAAAELALAFVLVVFLLEGVVAFIQDDGSFRN